MNLYIDQVKIKQQINVHRPIMKPQDDKQGAESMQQCPFMTKMLNKKPMCPVKNDVTPKVVKNQNVDSEPKRIMTDQMFKTLLRSFRSFFRKLLVAYNNVMSGSQKCVGKVFIDDLGLSEDICMNDYALQFIILPINHP